MMFAMSEAIIGRKEQRIYNAFLRGNSIANRERFYDSSDRVYKNYEVAPQEFVGG